MKVDKTIKIKPKAKKFKPQQPKNDDLPNQGPKSKLGERFDRYE
jgi:hypothetical protein